MKNVKKLRIFFSLTWKISPSYLLLLFLSTLIGSGQIIINVMLPKYLVDELMGDQNQERLIFLGCLIVGLNVLFVFLNQSMKRVMDVKNLYMAEKMNQAMSEKIMNIEFSCLENPYYLDLKERSVFATNNQAAMQYMIIGLADMLKNLMTILGLLTIMFTLGWELVVLLVITIGLTLLVQKRFMKYQTKFFQDILPTNRKYGYYINLAYTDKLQKDIRLYGMNEMLTDRVTQYNEEINTWFGNYYRKQGKYLAIYGIINDLQAAIAYGYVGLRVISNVLGERIGIGSFLMYVSAAINFTTSTMAFGKSVIDVMQKLDYLEPFLEFMSLPEEEKQNGSVPFPDIIDSVRFEHVSFHYPNSDTMVLKDISFDIKKGEKISIVGLNGSGKTTLIKLICRLYHPTKGNIYINGRNIFDYEYRSYMKRIAAVFQDYKLFAFTIEENITCKEEKQDTEKALELLEKVGLKNKISNLPAGVSSMFGKAYDENGIEMSGGENQKVAIARALYKEASLIILDEPTSALDPLAEAEIYENFNHLVGEKTAIYISHRMSSSVFCDKILVIDGGAVADFDSHEVLMQNTESLYYKLFHSQAVHYQV